jgi:large subunit ribosomal protein L24
MNNSYKIRLKKGDTVIVRNGKYKGKTGKIISVLPKANSVIVEGVNVAKRHLKPNKSQPQGGIVEINKPINISKVGIYEPTLKKASRIRYVQSEGGKKRFFVASDKEIK